MQLCVSVSLMSCTVLTFIRALAHIPVAATNELVKQEGWIHHLARHAVACYLTRGQCYISWERGTEVFDGKTGGLNQLSRLLTSSMFSVHRVSIGLGSW